VCRIRVDYTRGCVGPDRAAVEHGHVADGHVLASLSHTHTLSLSLSLSHTHLLSLADGDVLADVEREPCICAPLASFEHTGKCLFKHYQVC